MMSWKLLTLLMVAAFLGQIQAEEEDRQVANPKVGKVMQAKVAVQAVKSANAASRQDAAAGLTKEQVEKAKKAINAAKAASRQDAAAGLTKEQVVKAKQAINAAKTASRQDAAAGPTLEQKAKKACKAAKAACRQQFPPNKLPGGGGMGLPS
jgi:hypothetical protein